MGVVYRARDTRLGREVAIKTLPDGLARDPQRLHRFEREARALAALNHPNVATLHDFFGEPEHHISFLVMELVEGDTLADRIRRGPMPARDAALLFVQIAEGLGAAHEKGFVHRDLKPANIKISPDGRVKILDFGLAKAMVEPAAGDLTVTGDGSVMGTAAFMSPEQLQGALVDRRADIWAFGVCLFETLTGRRPFEGDSWPQVLAAVLKKEVDWQALPAGVPAPLRRLLRRCLQKEPRQRLHDIADARPELNEVLHPDEAFAEVASVPVPPARIGRPLTWGLAGLALGAAVATVLLWNASRSGSAGDAAVARLPLAWAAEPLAARVGMDREIEFAALSPDGRVIVYRGGGMLQVRRLDALESEPLPGTEAGRGPFFSPDGKWVGFFTESELKKVALDGGSPETIAQTSAGWCGSWGTDDTIVIGRSGLTGLWRVPAAGGKPEPLTEPAEGEADHDWPALLPGGKAVLYANAEVSYALGEAQIVAQSLGTSERKVLVEGGTYPRYSPSGHLLYAHNGALFAARFDPERLELLGRPTRVVDGLQQARNGSAQYSVGRDGTLLYVRGGTQWPRTRPVWVDRSGRETETAVGANHFAYQALSRDGSRIAAEVREPSGAGDLWIYDLMTGRATRLTFDRAGISDPLWSLDDAEVFFASGIEGGRGKLYRKRSDGTGNVEWLADAPIKPRSLSPDGHLVGIGFGRGTDRDILMLEPSTRGQPQPIIATNARELDPQISADGRWIAYVSDESGRNEIYVRPFPEVEAGRWQVSTRGGLFPRWHPKGRELFYLEGSSVMAVEIVGKSEFQGGVPARVVDGPYVGTLGGWGGFGVSPDGEHFLLYKQAIELGEAGELVLVLNWFDELERLVPAE
jgi:serine/threonine-protein kinase